MGAQLTCQSNDEDVIPRYAPPLSNIDLFVSEPSNGTVGMNKEVSIPVDFTPSVAYLAPRRVESIRDRSRPVKKSLKRFVQCATESNLRTSKKQKTFDGSKRSSLPMELLRKDFVAVNALFSSRSYQLCDFDGSSDRFISSECLETPRKLSGPRNMHQSSVIADIQLVRRFLVRTADAYTPRFEEECRWPSDLINQTSNDEFKALRCIIDDMIRVKSDSQCATPEEISTPAFLGQVEGFTADDNTLQSDIINQLEAQIIAEETIKGEKRLPEGCSHSTTSSEVRSRLPGKVLVHAPSSFAEDNVGSPPEGFFKLGSGSSAGGCAFSPASKLSIGGGCAFSPVPSTRTASKSIGGCFLQPCSPSDSKRKVSEVGEYLCDLADRIRVLGFKYGDAPELKEFATEIEILTRRYEKTMNAGGAVIMENH